LIFFVSDLHLSPRSPGATRLFLQFLGGRARQADELFILGDLFEAWIGDDDCDAPFNAEVVAALRLASESGLKISAMHGNRDFLLGTGFTAASGVKLLNDPYVLSTAEWQFVLSHGDALCLDDSGLHGLSYPGAQSGMAGGLAGQTAGRTSRHRCPHARSQRIQSARQGKSLHRPASRGDR
jgi:UDP-2,3-diacylglucosamine diphosphatase